MNKLIELHKTDRLVFTAQDLGVIWQYSEERKLFELIKYYVRRKELFVLTRGLYALKDFSEDEMRLRSVQYAIANKLVPNSYVSLYTVLKAHGLTFQYFDAVYSVAGRSVSRVVKGVRFEYKKIKDDVLFNDWGMEENEGGLRVAKVARAVCDSLYLSPQLAIEYPDQLQRATMVAGAKIYQNKALLARVKELTERKNAKYCQT